MGFKCAGALALAADGVIEEGVYLTPEQAVDQGARRLIVTFFQTPAASR